ncbi:MAG: hypothetical protein H6531_08295 [Actinobacteria bacterium]|nr:hypothetical protein [Thermoleophilia bacterium]MCB9011815.1 hypothetical protein [Actinomycetota bacterium]
MVTGTLTSHEYHLVADVADREGWSDLASPPIDGAMRTVREQQAVLRYRAALAPQNPVGSAAAQAWFARIVIIVLSSAGFLACWIASPGRTVGALVVVTMVMGIAAMRRRGLGRTARRTGRRSGPMRPRLPSRW